MAVGDAVSGYASVANNGTTTIQPGASIEWLIHTLFSESGAQLTVQMTDGTDKTVDVLAGGSVHGLTWRLTNSIYMKIKNTSGGTVYIGYQGVITK